MRIPPILALARTLTALALVALAVGCSTPTHREQRSAPQSTLRVMTFNIHHGADAADRLDLNRIAEVIRRERPDVVALQEVDRGVERTQRRDLLAELAALTQLPHTAFGKNIDYQGGAYGNGILSRFPIRRSDNLLLEQTAPGERRGVLQAVLDVGGREVAVLSTHLDVRSGQERLLSAEQIEQKLLPVYRDRPLVLAGDFNESPDGPVYRRITAHLADAWRVGEGPGYTIPVHAPARRIDFVFHNALLTALAARVPATDASDHLPVVAEFRFAR